MTTSITKKISLEEKKKKKKKMETNANNYQ